jgi:hypothetical protein
MQPNTHGPEISEGTEFITPRELAVLAEITPNMVFTYIRTKRIWAVRKDDKWVINKQYAETWARDHVSKRRIRQERQQALRESQLSGW